jgi:hypothetical protein
MGVSVKGTGGLIKNNFLGFPEKARASLCFCHLKLGYPSVHFLLGFSRIRRQVVWPLTDELR